MNTTSFRLSTLHIVIIVLTLITAFIHFSLMLPKIDLMFTLNGLGYLGLLVLFFAPIKFLHKYHELIRVLFIGYTILTIILWVIFGMRSMQGYVSKISEIGIITLLLLDRKNK
ncbi:MAG: hypothetical protein AB9891_21865 [Anaerolineaceae bacterium]